MMNSPALESHLEFRNKQGKLTKQKLADFLYEHRSEGLTLNIGAGNLDLRTYFPNVRTMDINPQVKPDYVCNAEDMHDIIDNNSIDVVLCFSVLEHTHHPQKVIDEIYRVLKPNGQLLLSVPFVFHLHESPYDYWRFTKYGLALMLQAFDDVTISDSMSTMETFEYMFYRMRLYTRTKYSPLIGKLLFGGLRRIFRLLSSILDVQQVRSNGQPFTETNIFVSDYFVIAFKK